MGVETSRDFSLFLALTCYFHSLQQHFPGRSVHGAHHEKSISRSLAKFLKDPSSILKSD